MGRSSPMVGRCGTMSECAFRNRAGLMHHDPRIRRFTENDLDGIARRLPHSGDRDTAYAAFAGERFLVSAAAGRALGYFGDSIINSMSDIFVCALGFVVAARLGFKKGLAVFVIIELLLLLWVRDNLTLNVIMLINPVEAIKAWQSTI